MRLPSGAEVPVTRFSPHGAGPYPAWIALHGVTRAGRAHPTLVRFAQALAASGAVVFIPEISTWQKLDLDTAAASPVVRAAVEHLSRAPDVAGPPGLIGFSFGAPQVLRIAADPVLGSRLAGVAAFGGYADLDALIRFQMTGDVQSDGGGEFLRPDPYARWVIAANCLPHAEGGERLRGVADALRALASSAGDRGTVSFDPIYDPLKDELEASLPSEHRAVFRLFAPESEADPPSTHPELEMWMQRLVDAARRVDPALELPDRLDLQARAHILHGRNDNLIPWTEAAATASRVRSPRPRTTVTSLFAHSGRDSRGRVADTIEALRLAYSLGQVLDIP